MSERFDIAVIGAGAAGLMAAIWAGRSGSRSVIALDGARTLGAKILVAGGGRCNVTHHAVDESAYAGGPGSTRPAIRNVLKRFDVQETTAFFREMGVELKREDTGKLFPTTDNARSILNALLQAAADERVLIRHPWRVGAIDHFPESQVFRIRPQAPVGMPPGPIHVPEIIARRVILATGGMALPKSGSDGLGYGFARSLGHTTTGRIFPALVPLTLSQGHFLTQLSGIAVPAALEVKAASGKSLARFENSTLFTHFGLSGPGVLDISRYYLSALAEARQLQADLPVLTINFLPSRTAETFESQILELSKHKAGQTVSRVLLDAGMPERLARALAAEAGLDSSAALHTLSRDARRRFVRTCCELVLPVTGDRGFTHAEVTAGGVPLSELHLKTLESRACPGLHLCGEILDVDGRIGGFNFQWAWASGYIAGTSAVKSMNAIG